MEMAIIGFFRNSILVTIYIYQIVSMQEKPKYYHLKKKMASL